MPAMRYRLWVAFYNKCAMHRTDADITYYTGIVICGQFWYQFTQWYLVLWPAHFCVKKPYFDYVMPLKVKDPMITTCRVQKRE